MRGKERRNRISDRKEPCSLVTWHARNFLWVREKETCGGETDETVCEVTPLLLSSSERQKEKGRLILSWEVRLNCVDVWVGLCCQRWCQIMLSGRNNSSDQPKTQAYTGTQLYHTYSMVHTLYTEWCWFVKRLKIIFR